MAVDNTECDKDIDFFQLSLIRTIQTHRLKGKMFFKETKVAQQKFEGLAHHSFEERTLALRIPSHELKNYASVKCKEEKELLMQLTPSIEANFFKVSYHVMLAIRHSSWDQRKSGKVIKMPIKISQRYLPSANAHPANRQV